MKRVLPPRSPRARRPSRTATVHRSRASIGVLASTALASATLALACNGKVTRNECTEMLDRYLDMVVAGDSALAELPAAEAHAAREMKKALRKGEPGYTRVHDQCESEISRREYRCAMKAPNPETWQACID